MMAPATSPGPGFPAILDDVGVAGTVEDHGRDVGHVLPEGLGHPFQVGLDRGGDVDGVGGLGPGGDLLHIDAGAGVEHRAPLGEGDDGDGVGPAQRRQRRAVDRVDGDVDEGRMAVADGLAVVEHRGLVLLPLADDDDPVHRHAGEHGPHGVDRRAVRRLLVAATHPPGAGHGRRLGDPDELHPEVAVRKFLGLPHAS
jgi:hypothetical protein